MHEIGLVLFEYRFPLNSSFSLFAVVSNFNFEPEPREKKNNTERFIYYRKSVLHLLNRMFHVMQMQYRFAEILGTLFT